MSDNVDTRQWDYCPTCSAELDTGFECLGCGLDWREWAMMFENVTETGGDDN